MRLNKNIKDLNINNSDNRVLYLIIIFSICIRILLFLIYSPWDQQVLQNDVIKDDAVEYHDLALGILDTKDFTSFQSFRTPGYPIFLAICYFLFGIRPWVVLFIQILLNIVSLIIVYYLGKKLFNKRVGLISIIFFALDPHQILFANILLADTLFVTVFLSSILFLILGLKANKVTFLYISSFLLGVSTLIKPIAFLFPIVSIFLILFLLKIKYLYKFKYSFFYIIVFIITISPWLCRNYLKYEYAKLSSLPGYHLLFYNVAYTEVEKTGLSIEQVRNELNNMAKNNGMYKEQNPFEKSRIYNNISKMYILNNWKIYILKHMKGIINMYVGVSSIRITRIIGIRSTPLKADQFACPSILSRFIDFFKTKSIGEIIIALSVGIFLMVCSICFFWGSIILLINKRYFAFLIFILIILYFSALIGVAGVVRYKLPITPFYIIISAIGILHISDYIADKRRIEN